MLHWPLCKPLCIMLAIPADITVGMLAVGDRCEPRLKTVELAVPSQDPGVLHWPLCTPLLQCGGCCGHDALECRPTLKQQIMLQVRK